jgi:hypothetical protein
LRRRRQPSRGHRDVELCGTIEESDTSAEVFVSVAGDEDCVNLSKIDGEWKINDL